MCVRVLRANITKTYLMTRFINVLYRRLTHRHFSFPANITKTGDKIWWEDTWYAWKTKEGEIEWISVKRDRRGFSWKALVRSTPRDENWQYFAQEILVASVCCDPNKTARTCDYVMSSVIYVRADRCSDNMPCAFASSVCAPMTYE